MEGGDEGMSVNASGMRDSLESGICVNNLG